VTLPPIGKKIFMSEKTGLLQVVVHALVFAVVLYALSSVSEGFQGKAKAAAKPVVSPAVIAATSASSTATTKASRAGAAANTSLAAAAKSRATAAATAAADAATAAAIAYTEAAAAATSLATAAAVPIVVAPPAPTPTPTPTPTPSKNVDSIGQQFFTNGWPGYFPPAPPDLLSACSTLPQPNNACYQLTRLAFPQCADSFDACFSQYM